ncbi:MAG: hypothetical protein ACLT9P_06800 [Evtepia gabavorous]
MTSSPAGAGQKPEPVELVLRDLPEFSQEELMTMEKEVTGLYLSGHPMDAYRDTVRAQGAVPIGSVLEDFAQEEGPASYQDGQRVLLAGVIAASKTKTTQNNTLDGLCDPGGRHRLPGAAGLLPGAGGEQAATSRSTCAILAEGRISVRDEKAPQLMCDRVTPLSQVPEPAGAAAPLSGKLYLRFARSDDPLLTRVRNLFVLFPGQQTAVLYLADSKRRLGARCLLPPRPAPGAERAAGGGKCGAPMTLRPLHKKGLPSL